MGSDQYHSYNLHAMQALSKVYTTELVGLWWQTVVAAVW